MKQIVFYSILIAAGVRGCQETTSLETNEQPAKIQDSSLQKQSNEADPVTLSQGASDYLSTSSIDIVQKNASNSLITKFDNSGHLVWQKQVNGSVSDITKSIVPSPDGGCFIISSRLLRKDQSTSEPLVFMTEVDALNGENKFPEVVPMQNNSHEAELMGKEVGGDTTSRLRQEEVIKKPYSTAKATKMANKRVQMNLWFPD